MAENVGNRGSVWFYRFDLPPGPDGRRHQKRVSGFPTERDARRALGRAKLDVADGRMRHFAGRTVSDLVGEWLEAVSPNRKATTVANYAMLTKAYIAPRIGEQRLDRLTPADIQKLYGELRRRGGRDARSLSGTQLRNVHRVLHNLLNYATRLGYVARNPADQVEKPREDTEERLVYTPEQVRQFLDAAESDRLRAMWCLVVAIGLRRGELAGLRWGDVDLDGSSPTLTVRRTRTSAGGQVADGEPKTRSSRRAIVLDEGSVMRLEEHRRAMLREAELRGDPGLRGHVFVDELGGPYRPAWLTRSLRSLQRRAELPEITLHDLRHTAGVRWCAPTRDRIGADFRSGRLRRTQGTTRIDCTRRCETVRTAPPGGVLGVRDDLWLHAHD
ncbi:MAG TPA: tyrosine-type recombinase/integrase [Acidimicrobiales bacterium]|nr:tyrosine-type recombinase/integrase [Acidimicrobiales bacterium]